MTLLVAFSFWGFVKGLLMLVCILSALLLMLVVLLQEPKGGGLSSAFGGAGAETFGVQTGSVNKFTAYVALVFMVSALFYAAIRPDEGASVLEGGVEAPEEPDADEAPEKPAPPAEGAAGADQPVEED